MLTLGNVLFIAFGCFGFLLDPLIKKILNLSQPTQRSHEEVLPWLKRRQSGRATNASFSAEIAQLYELYLRCIRTIREQRSGLAVRVARILRTKYPLMLIQVDTSNPILDYINWQSYDLCVVHESELHNVEPSLKFVHEWIISEGNHYNYMNRVSTLIMRKPSVLSQMREDNVLGISIKWNTIHEASVQVERSKFVFRYLQLYPNLPKVYFLLTVILMNERLVALTWRDRALNHLRCLTDQYKINLIEDPLSIDGKFSLDRYTLFLLLAAYFDNYANESQTGDITARHLLGFCNVFKDKIKSYLVEGTSEPTNRMKLDIIAPPDESSPKHAETITCGLAVFDPCLSNITSSETSDKSIQNDDNILDPGRASGCLNLAQKLHVWQEIQECLSWLGSMVEDSLESRSEQSTMATMLEKSRAKGQARFNGARGRRSKSASNQLISKADCPPENQENTATGATWRSKLQTIARTVLPYGLFGNIGFLLIYFVIRLVMVRYISDLQRMSESESREGLIALKKMVLEGGRAEQESVSCAERIAARLEEINAQERAGNFIVDDDDPIDRAFSPEDPDDTQLVLGTSDEEIDAEDSDRLDSYGPLAKILENMPKEFEGEIDVDELLGQMEVLVNLGLFGPPDDDDSDQPDDHEDDFDLKKSNHGDEL